jgi:hypothetical protein
MRLTLVPNQLKFKMDPFFNVLAPLVDINNTKTAYNASGDVSNSIDCDGGTKD